ncbi:sister chromatid cohesion protein PDS5 homolog B-B-like isoform X2 [Periplaneta americana]|uniref:sister chromatid cohesion protein PDS5 homolog B-B-like isoform X2 n=1 Tax=Periplaneta americana TaxID=6978 RepID=UPI0037E8EC06
MSDDSWSPPFSADQPLKELLTSLKCLYNVLKEEEDEQENLEDWIYLVEYLSKPDFMAHRDPLVQLFVAICLVELLGFLPSGSLDWEDNKLMAVLQFLIKQVELFRVSGKAIHRYSVRLVENLRRKSVLSQMFLQLEHTTNKEMICNSLLETVYTTVRQETNLENRNIVHLLCSFIKETEYASETGVDIILYSVLKEVRENNPAVQDVSESVLKECGDLLGHSIRMLLARSLESDGSDPQTKISGRELEVMYEVHMLNPNLLLFLWNHLSDFLQEVQDTERKKTSLSLLAHMFSSENPSFFLSYRNLWWKFKHYINKSAYGRRLLVKTAPKFFNNLPADKEEILQLLQNQEGDKDITLRIELVKGIRKTIKMNPGICKEMPFLDILKNLACDKHELVYKEALLTLGLVYRHLLDSGVDLLQQAAWIANTVMHMYGTRHRSSLYRPLIERVLVQFMVSCSLPARDRMENLLQLWCLFDDQSRACFHHSQHLMKTARAWLRALVSTYTKPEVLAYPAKQVSWIRKVAAGKLSESMGDQEKAYKSLLVLVDTLAEEEGLLDFLRTYISDEDYACGDYGQLLSEYENLRRISETKKRKGRRKSKSLAESPVPPIVKSLCARVGSLLVDQEAMQELVNLVEDCLNSDAMARSLHIDKDLVGKRAVELLYEYFYVMPRLAFQVEVSRDLLAFLLTTKKSEYNLQAMKIFISLAKYKNLGDVFPDLVADDLAPVWTYFALSGSPQQAKLAARCLCLHVMKTDAHNVLGVILQEALECSETNSGHFLTRLVAVGHFACYLPADLKKSFLPHIVDFCEQVLQDIILEDKDGNAAADDGDDDVVWCNKDDLPFQTRCKVEALKAFTRVTISVDSLEQTEATLTVLSSIVQRGSDYPGISKLSAATRARLRLTAGCCFLKICTNISIFYRQVRNTHFLRVAALMLDESQHVKLQFVKKLAAQLMEGGNCALPSAFLAYFVLAPMEEDAELKKLMTDTLNHSIADIRQHLWNIRRIWRLGANTLSWLRGRQSLMPECSVQAALQVLVTHMVSAQHARSCLAFLLDALLNRKNGNFARFSTTYYSRLFHMVRQHSRVASALDINEDIAYIHIEELHFPVVKELCKWVSM